MLPAALQPVAAVALIVGGALTCFAGYRLFKIVLGIYGFVLGAVIASSMVGAANTIGMIVAAILGGAVGAIVLVLAYFVGIALVGAGLGVLAAHLAWTTFAHADPPAIAVIAIAVLGGIGAMLLQRYVIVAATAFGGAWTLLVGVLTLATERAPRGPHPVWIFYPLPADAGGRWAIVVWIVLGVAGTIVQLGLTGRRK
ncbi:MAG: DUF4203 domain-containing protein [Betaproteobacteria bacterium]